LKRLFVKTIQSRIFHRRFLSVLTLNFTEGRRDFEATRACVFFKRRRMRALGVNWKIAASKTAIATAATIPQAE
jgi:hypothetical protein